MVDVDSDCPPPESSSVKNLGRKPTQEVSERFLGLRRIVSVKTNQVIAPAAKICAIVDHISFPPLISRHNPVPHFVYKSIVGSVRSLGSYVPPARAGPAYPGNLRCTSITTQGSRPR